MQNAGLKLEMNTAEDLSKLVRRKRALAQSKAKKSEAHDSESESEIVQVKKCKDDGEIKHYEQRLAAYMSEKAASESKSAGKADFNFDGGLKVPHHLWKALYKYQKTGVKWLWELHCQQVGGILGDEMGLGKTIQVVVFLAALHHSRVVDKAPPRYRGLGPTIIVTPVTVMHQWVKEFHSWYPPIRVAILHSTGTSNASASNLLHSIVSASGVILTSYSTFLNHQDDILRHRWQYIILDEGHKIRNPEAQVTVSVKRLKTVHRVILSGSPIQNNLKELWSLYDFVFPGKLGMLTDFMEHFAVPITQGGYANASQTQVLTAYKCACVLRESISPYLIRRLKADVNAKQLKLPNKSEQVLFCRLTKEQRAVYKEYIGSGEVESIMSGRLLVFPGLIKLRKICNHPDLTTGELRTKYSEGKLSEREQEYGYYKRAGKLVVCKSLLEMWKRQGRKVLLFTQSTQMLDILESFTQTQGYQYLRMDGTTAIGARQVLVNKFNQDAGIFVFLLTTRVGGLGVNLTGASRIIIYDPDWNPSTDMQARERAWRIGQGRDVIIYRLICTGSVEEKIYQRQIFKQFLTNKILANPKQRRFFRSGDLKDLFSLGEDEDDKQDSETHAIFAGTGSRIDLKKIQKRADAARKQAKLEAVEREAEEKKRKEKLWEMARLLSQKVEQEKTEQETITQSDGENSKNEKDEEKKEDNSNPTVDTANLTDRESKVISSALVSETRNIINTDLFNNLGDLDFESRMEDKEETVPQKKSADTVRCEGKSIPGLAKVRKWKYTEKTKDSKLSGEENSTRTETEDEDYVLGKLLKKSLVNGAMKHDTIVDACNADYAIMEAEADKVAKQAAEHLRRAKKRIKSQQDDDEKIPPQRPRFGSKSITVSNGSPTKPVVKKKTKSSKTRFSNGTAVLPDDTTTTRSSNDTLVRTDSGQKEKSQKKVKKSSFIDNKIFNGAALSFGKMEGVITDSDTPLPSSVLLKAMRLRSGIAEDLCDSDHARLSENIREFILSQRNTITACSYVTTQQVVEEFPTASGLTASTFRAILRELCIYSKVDNVGRWTLKTEFS